MAWFSATWTPALGELKLGAIQRALLPGEDVWYLGPCRGSRLSATYIALTSQRLVLLAETTIAFEARYSDIRALTLDPKKGTGRIDLAGGGNATFRQVPPQDVGAIDHYYRHGKSTSRSGEVTSAAETLAAEGLREKVAAERSWPGTTVHGKLSKTASLAVLRQCHGSTESPWLIISAGTAGLLAAFEDRLVIIKTGFGASLMAGAFGGERSATFHFTDITGIEYNSGLVTGVLEVLTPSYNGTANRDYWRGTLASRNADSNDPWTLSNCLPLGKVEYNNCLRDIQELKARIGRAKQPQPTTAAAPAPVSDGLTHQLAQLADLHSAGALTDEEFTAAKARLLA